VNTTHPQEQQGYTNSIPDKQEILETLKAMRKNASPGPDGFNVAFYISAWEWIGDDVAALVKEFYLTGILPSHVNDTHIALIPKKKGVLFSF
jgi:carbohydrate-binding DOMON domain-containing protein